MCVMVRRGGRATEGTEDNEAVTRRRVTQRSSCITTRTGVRITGSDDTDSSLEPVS